MLESSEPSPRSLELFVWNSHKINNLFCFVVDQTWRQYKRHSTSHVNPLKQFLLKIRKHTILEMSFIEWLDRLFGRLQTTSLFNFKFRMTFSSTLYCQIVLRMDNNLDCFNKVIIYQRWRSFKCRPRSLHYMPF